jgi:uncharacterized protein YbaR (Trm112 family)
MLEIVSPFISPSYLADPIVKEAGFYLVMLPDQSGNVYKMNRVPLALQLDRADYLKSNPLTPIALLRVIDGRVSVLAECPMIKKQCEAVYGVKYSIPYLLNTEFISEAMMLSLAVDGAHNAFSVSRDQIQTQASQEIESLKMTHQTAMLKLIRGNGIESNELAPKAITARATEVAPKSAADHAAESKKARKPRIKKEPKSVNTVDTVAETVA